MKLITNVERTKASDAKQSQNKLHKNYVSKLDKKEKIMKKGKNATGVINIFNPFLHITKEHLSHLSKIIGIGIILHS